MERSKMTMMIIIRKLWLLFLFVDKDLLRSSYLLMKRAGNVILLFQSFLRDSV